jgi:ribose transport system ATP-binding protein
MDSGEILLEGKPIQITSPYHAQQLGISMIYQEFNLIPYLSVAENIFLGREPRIEKTPLINWKRMYEEANEVLRQVGLKLDVRIPVAELSIAQQQMVEIAKALSIKARIIVMDEPSATLTEHELKTLFELIKTLRRQNLGIIYISHRLKNYMRLANVLRLSVMAICSNAKECDVTREELILIMMGRELTKEYPKYSSAWKRKIAGRNLTAKVHSQH